MPDQEAVAEKVTSTDPVLNVMLQQVQVVLPYASGRAVLCDLGKDGSTTRCFCITLTCFNQCALLGVTVLFFVFQ